MYLLLSGKWFGSSTDPQDQELLPRQTGLVPPRLLTNALQHKGAVNLKLLLRDIQQLFPALEDLKPPLL